MKKRTSKMESTDRNRLSTGQALRRRKYLLSGLLQCGQCGGNMTVAGAAKYKTYYCANAKEKGPSVCTGFRGLRDSIALPLVLSGLRDELMQPDAYAAFQERVRVGLDKDRETATDRLRIHDLRVRELETGQRNLVALARQGLGSQSLIDELKGIEAELTSLEGARDKIVPAEVVLPDNLPDLYRELVGDLAATLSDEAVSVRAADQLHEMVDRVIVNWDADANGHRLTIEGNLLEMLRKSAPSELEAVSGAIFAEVGCGSRI